MVLQRRRTMAPGTIVINDNNLHQDSLLPYQNGVNSVSPPPEGVGPPGSAP